jgi:hypothetical protein
MPALWKDCDGTAGDTPLGVPHSEIQHAKRPQRRSSSPTAVESGGMAEQAVNESPEKSSIDRTGRRRSHHPAHATTTSKASTHRETGTKAPWTAPVFRTRGGADRPATNPPRRHGRVGREAEPHPPLLPSSPATMADQRREELPKSASKTRS